MVDSPTHMWCSSCGQSREQETESTWALAWSVEYVEGRAIWVCPACVRANVRAIESKLPTEYW